MMPTSESARQGSNRSEVWKYFTETVGGAKCKICGQIRVRSDKSTKTMHDHLRTAHKDVSYQKAYPNRKPQRLVPSVRPPKASFRLRFDSFSEFSPCRRAKAP